jgi:rhomboid protease GluP
MTPEAERPIPITPQMLLSRRVDFERRMRRFPPLTVAIIGLLALVFVMNPDVTDSAVEAGALLRDQVVEGEYWRFLSATLLHASPDHLVGNAVALFILGMICEHAFGVRQFLVLYVGSALAGSLVSVVVSKGPSVGASGALFGLQAAAILLFYRHRGELLVRDKRVGLVLFVWAVLTVTGGLVTPYIDNGAHIGGAVAGALIAHWLHPVVLSRPAPEGRAGVLRTCFWISVVLVGYSLVAWSGISPL